MLRAPGGRRRGPQHALSDSHDPLAGAVHDVVEVRLYPVPGVPATDPVAPAVRRIDDVITWPSEQDVLAPAPVKDVITTVSYTHLRAHETKANLVCRLLLEKKKKKK